MEKTDKWKKMINQYRDAAYDGDESESYPYLNRLRKPESEVLQTRGGYIANAVKADILPKKYSYEDIKKISQKWHYFVSYIYMYQELGIGRGKKTADLQNEKKITQLKNLVKKENTTKQNQEEQIQYVLNQIDNNEVNMNNWTEPGDIKCSELLIWMWEVGKSEDNLEGNNDINELISITESDARLKKSKTEKITILNKIIKDNLCPDNL